MIPIDVYEQVAELREKGYSHDKVAAILGISTDQAKRAYAKVRDGAVQRLATPPGEAPHMSTLPSIFPAVHPKGWEPGFTFENHTGTVTTEATTDSEVVWSAVLEKLGFDPDLYEVVPPINVRTWDANIGGGETRQMYYHKANVILRRSPEDKVDVEALAEEIRTHEPPKALATLTTGAAFVVHLSDWQLGKRDGDGTKGIVQRVLEGIDAVDRRIDALMYLGRVFSALYICGMGDLVEGCDGHYAMQTFEAELDRRDQVKIARRLILAAIRRWSAHFARVVVVCVPGNHGEHRKNGKLFTSWGDNDDVAVFEQVAEILAENPDAYGHVTFVIPSDELDVTLDMAGTIVTLLHGHQIKGGVNGAEAWWKGQLLGRRAAYDADMIVHAHFHHFSIKDANGRWIFACPSLESTSAWIKNTYGAGGNPSILTYTTKDGMWQDLALV